MDKIKTGIVKEKKDLDSVNLVVDLDSGLGVVDAFFASFSMILVSEVSQLFPMLSYLARFVLLRIVKHLNLLFGFWWSLL